MENTTAKKLNEILESVEDASLREDLFTRFYLDNPLDLAQTLHSAEIPDAVRAQLLALKVGMPPQYRGTDLGPLISRAMDQLWDRVAEACAGIIL